MTNLDRALEHHKAGRLAEAERLYRQILDSRPEHPEALHLLGMVAAQRGEPEQAIDLIERAIRIDPEVAVYHGNLGEVLRGLGRLDAASDAYRRALELRFDNDTLDTLARILFAQGPVEQAVEVYLRALGMRPGDKRARTGLATLLRTVRPTGPWPELEGELERCFQSDDMDHQQLAGVAASQLKHRYGIPGREPSTEAAADAVLDALSSDALLIGLLTRCVNIDFELECFLTGLRRHLLLEFERTGLGPDSRLTFVAALAMQCFNNEFVFNEMSDEVPAIERLQIEVCERVSGREQLSVNSLEGPIALLACYRPLASLDCAPDLANLDVGSWRDGSRALMEHTLSVPLQEQAIEGTIDSLGDIQDRTSRAVRAQYEQNPYPRWLSIGRPEEQDLKSVLGTRFPYFTLPAYLDDDIRILVAGCGTGREPISLALMYPRSEVLAVDLSRSSLAYGVRMARALGASNVRFLQADILNLGRLEEHFHVISSAGVLHHMADPLAGWRVLAERLVPAGIMQVNLYSESARRPLTAAKEAIARRGLRPVAEDIRAFRTLVLEGKYGGSLADFTSAIDFYTMSNCRDLLFHVQEHRFTLRQLKDALDRLGLRLIGFDPRALHVPREAHGELLHETELADFAAWERLEQRYPRAFASMYRFWCQKV